MEVVTGISFWLQRLKVPNVARRTGSDETKTLRPVRSFSLQERYDTVGISCAIQSCTVRTCNFLTITREREVHSSAAQVSAELAVATWEQWHFGADSSDLVTANRRCHSISLLRDDGLGKRMRCARTAFVPRGRYNSIGALLRLRPKHLFLQSIHIRLFS